MEGVLNTFEYFNAIFLASFQQFVLNYGKSREIGVHCIILDHHNRREILSLVATHYPGTENFSDHKHCSANTIGECDALLVNMGTMRSEHLDSMLLAGLSLFCSFVLSVSALRYRDYCE